MDVTPEGIAEGIRKMLTDAKMREILSIICNSEITATQMKGKSFMML